MVTFSWYEGAEGYRRAIEEQAGTHRPLVVYFYTDWCPYCRRLDQGLLIDDEVKDYLRELIKVKINPENGTEERQIANGFGVRGYPSLFAKGYKRREFVRLRPSYRLGSVVHYQTPGEFVSSLQAATGYGSG